MLEEEGKVVTFVAVDGALVCCMALTSMLRRDAGLVVRALQRRGIQVVMLTGDNQRTANTVARKLGVSRVVAEATPAIKVQLVQTLQQV